MIRNHLLPPFGARLLEGITEDDVDWWARRLGSDRPPSNATKRKVIVIFHGVMARACRVYRLPVLSGGVGALAIRERSLAALTERGCSQELAARAFTSSCNTSSARP